MTTAMKVMHTPGPWRVDFESFPYEIEAEIEGKTIVVAEVPDEEPIGGGDAKSDAHLIAAAPDMLEALEAFKRAFEGFEGDIQARGLAAQVCIGNAIEKAKAAIAKAKGGAA